MIIEIDGVKCEAEYGRTILEIAKANGIYIPTICHDEALPGQVCCRMCIVEVTEGQRTRVVTACVYPVTREAKVATNSERIREMRRVILMLLLARAPGSEIVQKLAEEYGVEPSPRFRTDPREKCILCGLCVSACDKMGTGAISTVNRGITKKVSTPFGEPSAACIGCGACANVCRSGAIEVEEAGGKRRIWQKEFRLVPCSRCGKYFATAEQLAYVDKKAAVKMESCGEEALCSDCRAALTAEKLGRSRMFRTPI